MHLSTFTDYSLRTLFLVAANPEKLIRLADIAGYYDISIDHLRKVVHNLAKLNYLATHRGKYGGMTLAVPPEEINLGVLVKQTEGDAPLIDCSSNCCITPLCTLKSVLHQANTAFYDVLAGYTLADLLASPDLAQALLIEGP